MHTDITRRDFFRRSGGRPAEQRPPWARPEGEFIAACTQCGACIEACPTGVLVEGRARLPAIRFEKADCTFCGACATACPVDCFDTAREEPWTIRAHIGESCIETRGVACRMCEDVCDQKAIRMRPRLGGGCATSVSHELCTGCGTCSGICPVGAITVREPSRKEVLP
jgi:ferredoxin-type protein NapF